jgi:5-methylcytosine-specific restriction protein A
MAVFLFAWNPKKWAWKKRDLTSMVLEVARKGSALGSWSCGNRRDLPAGSRFFLIRLGVEPKGIVGSGRTTAVPELYDHWDAELRRSGKKAPYVELEFDFLSKEPLITWAELQKPPFSGMSWRIQASGVRLGESVVSPLETLWRKRSGRMALLPDESDEAEKYSEGARRSVYVNAFERNPQARAACIAHFGARCAVCRLALEERYGSIAAGFIHVHHVRPMSDVTREYRVDPKKDLVPICPNCHTVIHLARPPLSVRAARKLLRNR